MNEKTNDITTLIRGRRTIHNFIPGKRPDTQLIKEAIELARWAPNHGLTEPWHFYLLGPETAEAICILNSEVVKEKKGQKAAEKKLQRWQQIPGWLVLTCDQASDELTRQEDYAACCCAIQNLSLYLWRQGIGIKWTTGDVIRDPRFYDLIWVDQMQERVVGLIWYGYAEEIPKMTRSAVEQILVELP